MKYKNIYTYAHFIQTNKQIISSVICTNPPLLGTDFHEEHILALRSALSELPRFHHTVKVSYYLHGIYFHSELCIDFTSYMSI